MSSIIRFFVASPSDAIGSLNHGPGASLRVVEFGNFDVEEALLDWEAYLTNSTFDDLVDQDLPELVAGDDEGPTVLVVSDPLLTELGSISSFRQSELAKWWVDKKSRDGFVIELLVALQIIEDLIRLIREDRLPGERVYCWTA